MNDVISDAHRKRLREKHERDPNFGVIGHLWAERVALAMIECGATSLLDYGAGRSGLVNAVKAGYKVRPPEGAYAFREYEPAFGDRDPMPADFVTCIDVMEHVESDKVNAVLSHIRSLMNKRGIITISLRNATKKGRATHPNVQPREWWLEKLQARFYVTEIRPLDPTKAKSELAVNVEPIP